jgi:hypothetical protein
MMLIITVSFILSEILGEFWKKKGPYNVEVQQSMLSAIDSQMRKSNPISSRIFCLM